MSDCDSIESEERWDEELIEVPWKDPVRYCIYFVFFFDFILIIISTCMFYF